jgi:DNA-binding beta-propeller fold protein YncE
VVRLSNNQLLLSDSGYSDGGVFAPTGVAIDQGGRAWVANSGTNAVSVFGSTGAAAPGSPLTGGGLAMPSAVAIDGQGVVWVANQGTVGSISEMTFGQGASLSAAAGFGVLHAPAGIAVDASGSVWTANSGDNSVSEIIGIAAPATVPLATLAGP